MEHLDDLGLTRTAELPDLDHVRDHLEGAYEAIYDHGCIHTLLGHLEEMAHALGVEHREGQPKLGNKSNPMMQWYLGYQRCLMDQVKE